MTKLRSSKSLPVHIVEQHNDVVPFLHRAIASRQLPYSGIPVIHLDSHPDLLIPINLQADTVFQPQLLCETLSIENWLLPLAYAGHLDHIVWVKPPWAHQIKTSKQSFTVGKCAASGKMRLTSKENYFLTEGLFCPLEGLTGTKDVKLTVVELLPDGWADQDLKESLPTDVEKPRNHPEPTDSLISPDKWVLHLQDIVQGKPYVLDIDLDFFSTANPFKDLLRPEEEEVLRRLYRYSAVTDISDESIAAFTLTREKQINQLEDIFSALDAKWFGENTSCLETEIQNFSLADFTGKDEADLIFLDSQQQADLIFLCKRLLQSKQRSEITFMVLHYFGCTLDDTELPHHISTPAQVSALETVLKNVLERLPKPAVVTIARSSDDGYCPKDVVDHYQTDVLKMLENVYGSLQISKSYE